MGQDQPMRSISLLSLLWPSTKMPAETQLLSTLPTLVVWQYFIFSKEKNMSLCLHSLGYAWFSHFKFPLETTQPLWPREGNIVILDLPAAFPGWSKSKTDLFPRVSVTPRQMFCQILKVGTDFVTIFLKEVTSKAFLHHYLSFTAFVKIIGFINNSVLLFSWMDARSPWSLFVLLFFKLKWMLR